MELFKFNFDTDPTVLEEGELINGYLSIMWIERYREPGEFQIVADLSSGLRDFLPAGTLISHADTLEVMIVENHEFGEPTDEDSTLTISGRSFETYLENRIVGMNKVRASNVFDEYELTDTYTWNQAVTLINDHISATTDSNDALVNVTAHETVGGTGVSKKRVIPRDTVHAQLMELLGIDELGIKTVRRNTFGSSGSSTETQLIVHKGVDRSATVIFGWTSGDLEKIQYLFSDKRRKNSALVQGQYFNTIVDGTETKYDRRFMLVEADDIDSKYDTKPTDPTIIATILDRMTNRGSQRLRRQKRVVISSADVSDVTRYRYRRDYNVGDLVLLDGSFGAPMVVRVIEFAEIEDENGESGHPTLELPETTS